MSDARRIKLLLADDHKALREGLTILLREAPEFEVVGQASDGQEAVEQTGKLKPDLVLLDIDMPVMNGLEATRRIKALYPDVKVLISSHHDSEQYLFSALEAGANGYVLKQGAFSEVNSAIQSTMEGSAYISPGMTRILIQEHLKKEEFQKKTKSVLSPREQEVFKFLAEGHTNQEIADTLTISLRTVQTHRAHIMEKLNLRNRADLVQYAIKKGILTV